MTELSRTKMVNAIVETVMRGMTDDDLRRFTHTVLRTEYHALGDDALEDEYQTRVVNPEKK